MNMNSSKIERFRKSMLSDSGLDFKSALESFVIKEPHSPLAEAIINMMKFYSSTIEGEINRPDSRPRGLPG